MNQILPVRWKLTAITLRLSKTPFLLLEKISKPETRTNEALPAQPSVSKAANPAAAMNPEAMGRNKPNANTKISDNCL